MVPSSKLTSLADAVQRHVRPGAHLHFASTPSRANAAVLQVAAQFKDRDPRFTLSMTGFHSSAHLLSALRLGQRYIACFFGDNYPTPRPNALYTTLVREGAVLERWSLLSYVTALRAGAHGHAWEVCPTIHGTTLAEELMQHGKARRARVDDGLETTLVRAMQPDLAFIHASAGAADGSVVSSPPYSEGFHSALAARDGVIVTVEREASAQEIQARCADLGIPRERVLAVCVEPFGAHPQPHFVLPGLATQGYADDFDAYRRWRQLADDPSAVVAVGPRGYREWVGEARLDELARAATPTRIDEATSWRTARDLSPTAATTSHERLIWLAARAVAASVKTHEHTHALAGIGQAFIAARLARLRLAVEGHPLSVLVETGMTDLACGPEADEFLLSYTQMALARRLTDVEDVLGGLVCGAHNRCLGVLGAAQIDAQGRINSTRLHDGRELVGAGGATDIAAAAREVIVLSTCEPGRLVTSVDHVTSAGERVRTVVTDRCVLRRDSAHDTAWRVSELWVEPGESAADVLTQLRAACPWTLVVPEPLLLAKPAEPEERALVRALRRETPHA